MREKRVIEYWPHDVTYRAFTISPLGRQEMTAPDGSPAFGDDDHVRESLEHAKQEENAMRKWLETSL